MSEQGKFLTYCIQIYGSAKNLSGKEISALFQKHEVDKYLYDCYDALHIMGEEAIIRDIDTYINNHSA